MSEETSSPIHSQSQQLSAHPEELVADTNVNQISYENGVIQKKVYGDQVQTGQTTQLLIYLLDKHRLSDEEDEIITQIIRAENSLTLNECCILLEQRLKIALNSIEIMEELEGKPLDLNSSIGQLCQEKGQMKQLFVFYEPTKAIIKKKEEQFKYESLTKYSFLDDKNKVKVYIDLPGIGNLPENQIESRFLQRSIEVKIHGYNNKNFIFAVPKTQCCLRSKQSKVITKKDKIIISIAKMAEADNWHSLYKVKAIGEKDTD